MYALYRKEARQLSCIANTAGAHTRLVHVAFSNWAGMQPRGRGALFEDFISKYESVKVTLEPSGVVY